MSCLRTHRSWTPRVSFPFASQHPCSPPCRFHPSLCSLRTGPATHDQTIYGKEGRYNAALHKSSETGHPVRVVRGYKLDSRWAPLGVEYGGEINYRYDGLYRVEKAWLVAALRATRFEVCPRGKSGQPELQVEEAPAEEDE